MTGPLFKEGFIMNAENVLKLVDAGFTAAEVRELLDWVADTGARVPAADPEPEPAADPEPEPAADPEPEPAADPEPEPADPSYELLTSLNQQVTQLRKAIQASNIKGNSTEGAKVDQMGDVMAHIVNRGRENNGR
jgi:pyruvate/2-oxoglutarate dehydrogenase complex dihydrolipoamide acyltransferase (E2) component